MKLLDNLGNWLWHHTLEQVFGADAACAKCAARGLTPPRPPAYKPQEKKEAVKKRYGCPQDHPTAQDFIDSL